MGRHKYCGGAVRCEVCKERCTHQNCVVVARKASGTARVVHKRATCQRAWKYEGSAIAAGWPERRDEAPNTVPDKPPQSKPHDTPPTPPAAPQHTPEPVTPMGHEEAIVMTKTPKTPQANYSPRHFMKWKPALISWVLEELAKEPHRHSWGVTRFRLLRASAPELLVDEDGFACNTEQFSKLAQRLTLQQDAARSAAARVTPAAQPIASAQEGLKLVPVNTQAIIAENNNLRAAVSAYASASDAAVVVLSQVCVLLSTITHGDHGSATAAHERLVTLADLARA